MFHYLAHKLKLNNVYHEFDWEGDSCTITLKCCKCGEIMKKQFYKNFYDVAVNTNYKYL